MNKTLNQVFVVLGSIVVVAGIWVHVETAQSECPDRPHDCRDWQHYLGG